jgi:hypothetical protein
MLDPNKRKAILAAIWDICYAIAMLITAWSAVILAIDVAIVVTKFAIRF